MKKDEQQKVGGKINLGAAVVERIAGLVAREVDGVYAIGKSSISPFGNKDRRGVEAEVGVTEVALDLEVVVEYGVDIHTVVGQLKQQLAAQILLMTGRRVIEVNVDVIDIRLPEDEKPQEVATTRVH